MCRSVRNWVGVQLVRRVQREHQNAAAILRINTSINKKLDCFVHHNLLKRREDVYELKVENIKPNLWFLETIQETEKKINSKRTSGKECRTQPEPSAEQSWNDGVLIRVSLVLRCLWACPVALTGSNWLWHEADGETDSVASSHWHQS